MCEVEFKSDPKKYIQKETIDAFIVRDKDQITIPKEIPEKLGITKGDKLILDLKENKIIITKYLS